MSAPFRLAQLSDAHLPLAVPRGAELIGKRGLSAASWLRRRGRQFDGRTAGVLAADLRAAAPDAIAVLGDVINFSLEREFAAASGWLEALGPAGRVLVVPGNHEALVAGWRRRVAHWGAYPRGPEGEAWPWARRMDAIALIAVSTAIATPPGLATGRVGHGARARLARLLTDARDAGALPVVLMHHPPTRVTSRRKGLLDGPAVCRTLADGGAALVLHGHTHHPDLSWIDAPHGRIPVLGVPAFGMAPGGHEPPGAWNLLELAPADDGWHVTVHERAITARREVAAATPFRLRLPAAPLATGCQSLIVRSSRTGHAAP